MSALRAELLEIKNAMYTNLQENTAANGKSGLHHTNIQNRFREDSYTQHGMNFPRRAKKCTQCVSKNVDRCIHCFKCGSTEHTMFQYPSGKKTNEGCVEGERCKSDTVGGRTTPGECIFK